MSEATVEHVDLETNVGDLLNKDLKKGFTTHGTNNTVSDSLEDTLNK